MAAKLKVYTAPMGFHDVYVAAPSKAAALRAWGSDHDLFARGLAGLVTDPGLTKAPLADPGKVIRRLRGTADEQLAALPPDPPPARAGRKAARAGAKRKPPPPRPDRASLDAAARAVAEAEARHRDEEDDIAARIAALERERRTLRRRHAQEREALDQARAEAEAAYDAALRAHRAG